LPRLTRVFIAAALSIGLGHSEAVKIENRNLSLGFELGDQGIALTSIRNKTLGVEHVAKPTSLFEIASGGVTLQSNKGFVLDRFSRAKNGSSLTIQAHAKDLTLAVAVDVSLPRNGSVASVRVSTTNIGAAKISLHALIPKIGELVTAGPPARRMAMVPMEIGAVVPVEKTVAPNRGVGMRINPRIGMPTGMNSMEVASLYDADSGSGVYFADIDGDLDNGIAPLQLVVSSEGVAGAWVADLAAGETQTASRFAIGVNNTGDWHAAVDYYTSQHRPRWHFTPTPAWFREQGAFYSYTGSGSGAIYMQFPRQNLKKRIDSFEKLPQLLEEAQSFGSNTVFIADFWEGAKVGDGREYFNKGDYLPRTDLGGDAAFTAGIKALHKLGGRIIVYVECFIISTTSHIGLEKGEQWAGRDPAGQLYTHYRANYSMIPAHPAWQDYLVKVCERLVKDYDVDGIFLDSAAWQTNWPMQNKEEGKLYSSKEYSQGFLTVADRVGQAIRAIRPDTIVMGETTAGPIGRHWAGGLSADFAWSALANQNRIVASPLRYGVKEVNFISSGRTLNETNQIFAAGYTLGLCNAQLPWAASLKPLVEIRQKYKDALVYGDQVYQPATGDDAVAAYFYQGSPNRIITVANTSAENAYNGALTLRSSEANSTWLDLLTQETLHAPGGRLAMTVPAQGLRVLLKR
jgi:hypothetical protein